MKTTGKSWKFPQRTRIFPFLSSSSLLSVLFIPLSLMLPQAAGHVQARQSAGSQHKVGTHLRRR